jgi:hypothetical protein
MRFAAMVLEALAGCSSPTGGGGGVCAPACSTGRACCGSACVNTDNDPNNCGGCAVICSGATPFCGGGTCRAPPCTLDAGACASGSCCAGACCASGQLCCATEGPVGGEPVCFTPTAEAPTCPQGCAPLCKSDRASKTAVQPVNERQVLEQLASLPISTWSYTDDRSHTRHLGPMAQDFHAAFSLGGSDTSYDPVDAHGVSLAALKALAVMVDEQQRRIEALEAENRSLAQRTCR